MIRGLGGKPGRLRSLKAGYAGTTKAKELAFAYSLHRKWIRLVQYFVAAAFLRFQDFLLGAALAAALQMRRLVVVSRTKWGETGERLTAQQVSEIAGTPERRLPFACMPDGVVRRLARPSFGHADRVSSAHGFEHEGRIDLGHDFYTTNV